MEWQESREQVSSILRTALRVGLELHSQISFLAILDLQNVYTFSEGNVINGHINSGNSNLKPYLEIYTSTQ